MKQITKRIEYLYYSEENNELALDEIKTEWIMKSEWVLVGEFPKHYYKYLYVGEFD